MASRRKKKVANDHMVLHLIVLVALVLALCEGRMIRILTDTLVSVDHAGNMVVAKTLSGSANVAGEVLDTVEWPEILGTIAGDNTIMILVRTEADAAEIAKRIRLLAGTENGKADREDE